MSLFGPPFYNPMLNALNGQKPDDDDGPVGLIVTVLVLLLLFIFLCGKKETKTKSKETEKVVLETKR